MALVISTYYSRAISKPLIKINEAAKKMAKLDFDNYIEPNTLYLEFDQLPVVDELMKLPGIKRAEVLDNHGVRLWYDGERGTIKQVMREAVSRGWDMTELRKEKSSMEAVFAKLSGK